MIIKFNFENELSLDHFNRLISILNSVNIHFFKYDPKSKIEYSQDDEAFWGNFGGGKDLEYRGNPKICIEKLFAFGGYIPLNSNDLNLYFDLNFDGENLKMFYLSTHGSIYSKDENMKRIKEIINKIKESMNAKSTSMEYW